MNDLPCRKHPRLKSYDYSQNGAYFVTICTQGRNCVLSTITFADKVDDAVGRGLAPAEKIITELTHIGKIVEQQLFELENRYENLKIDKHIIMPNHIHAIILLDDIAAGASPRPTLNDVICAYKSLTTRLCNRINQKGEKLFQTSYFEHIIRNDEDYIETWNYIDQNPIRWIHKYRD